MNSKRQTSTIPRATSELEVFKIRMAASGACAAGLLQQKDRRPQRTAWKIHRDHGVGIESPRQRDNQCRLPCRDDQQGGVQAVLLRHSFKLLLSIPQHGWKPDQER